MPDTGNNTTFLRVGGRLCYTQVSPLFPEGGIVNGMLRIPGTVDLKNALRAEIVLEVMQCHEDTRGLSISLNANEWLAAPSPTGIPEPVSDYMYHVFPVIPVPLQHLKSENYFSLKVVSVQRWNWPQNLIYGAVLRISYHPPERTSLPVVRQISGEPGKLSALQDLGLSRVSGDIKQVEYLGLYEGVNYQGDNNYRQWQYSWFRGNLQHHIGTTTEAPFQVTWDTRMLPDQPAHLELAARVLFNDGLIYFTEPLKGLTLKRDYSVELCKPYNQPTNWVSRSGDFSSNVTIKGNIDDITDAYLIWRSWSPGYMNGVYINNHIVITREGRRYAYHEHYVKLDTHEILLQGENTIRTGLTPKYKGKLVHGMEVQWPGIMLLVRYSKPQALNQ